MEEALRRVGLGSVHVACHKAQVLNHQSLALQVWNFRPHIGPHIIGQHTFACKIHEHQIKLDTSAALHRRLGVSTQGLSGGFSNTPAAFLQYPEQVLNLCGINSGYFTVPCNG